MASNEGNSRSIQPDLEEFFSTLSGFVNKQAAPSDPGNLRFLEIFFRTVKSDKGHLLRVSESGQLRSVVSTGLDPGFDEEYNHAVNSSNGEPSPLDLSFRQKEPIAIVDLTRDPHIPAWFLKLMKRHQFASLVAVPLMGATDPIGILCAYYHDVCLFDRATLSHLMMIGRMVGGASENSLAAEQTVNQGEKDKSSDRLMQTLVSKTLTKVQIYALLAKIATEAVPSAGLVSGPLTKTSKGLTLTVMGATGVASSALSHQVMLPSFLAQKILKDGGGADGTKRALSDWGEMKSLVHQPSTVEAAIPLDWRNNLEGTLVAWRPVDQPFSMTAVALLSRLVDITCLALHTLN